MNPHSPVRNPQLTPASPAVLYLVPVAAGDLKCLSANVMNVGQVGSAVWPAVC
jgi:hypothetical protein